MLVLSEFQFVMYSFNSPCQEIAVFLYLRFFHTHSFGTDEGLETVNIFCKFYINVQTSGFLRFSCNWASAMCFRNLHKISLRKLFSVVIQSTMAQKRLPSRWVEKQLTQVCISLSGAWGGNYHYYLNVDRCAYGVLLKLSANVKGLCGPYIFAVNHNCTAVYYHQDAPHVGWKRYKSVEHYPELQRLLICKPYLSEIVWCGER